MHHEFEKFLAVIEFGSFTAAAKHIRVSQPALTTAIKSLEARYGSVLIKRGTKPLKLTPEGQTLYTSLNRVRLELNRLTNRLNDLKSQQSPKTSIGAIDSVAMHIFSKQLSTESLEVHVDNSSRLIEAVQAGRIELAFITSPMTAPLSNLSIKEVALEKFALVARPDESENVRTNLLRHGKIENFAAYNPESTTFQRMAAKFSAENIGFSISFASTSPELIRQVVHRGKGAAFLPLSIVMDDVKSKKLSVISELSFERPISLVCLPNILFSEIHKELLFIVTNLGPKQHT